MIPFDYNKIDSAREYAASSYSRKAADKSLLPLVEPLQDCTERDGIELFFVNIGNVAVPIWKAWDMAGNRRDNFVWWVLVSKDAKSIVTLSDFKENDLSDRSRFVAMCRKLKLNMTSFDDASAKAEKAAGKFDSLGFDPAKIDRIWRKNVYSHKKISPDEAKQLTAACHKLVDMLAKKDPAGLGELVFRTLAAELSLPTD